MKRLPPAFWFWLLPVLLGLPFIGRAYFVDDHYHVLMARGILEHPLRPYDFRAADDGLDNAAWERGRPPRMVNPPLHHYLTAAFLKAGGGRLWVARAGGLAFCALAAVFLSLIARRCLVPPGPAAVLGVLTPAFWLSSTALLIDSTMLTFFLGGLAAWIEGLKRRRPLLLASAGLLMGFAIVTKYTGGFVVVLAALYWWIDHDEGDRRAPGALLFLLIPAAVLGAWSAWNAATHGAPHLTESAKRVAQSFSWAHVLSGLTFFSGVLVLPMSALARASRGALAAAGAGAALLAAALASPWGGFTGFQSGMLALLSVAGLLYLVRVPAELLKSRVKTDLFLAGWLYLGALQMVLVMQWVAARYYLTILPPVVLLTLRSFQEGARHRPHSFDRRVMVWGAAMFALSSALAGADFLQASAQRRIVEAVEKDGWSGGRRFTTGDAFTSSYLGEAGWTPAFPATAFRPGDLVLQQTVVMPPWWFHPGPGWTLLKTYEYPCRFPVRVMDNRGAAGFYASAWGALPFTLSREPLERYRLWRVGDARART